MDRVYGAINSFNPPSSLGLTALKVISYFTVILPLLALVAKFILRTTTIVNYRTPIGLIHSDLDGEDGYRYPNLRLLGESLADGYINTESARGHAVIEAAINGHFPCLQALLANGPISESARGQAVENAARGGHAACITALLANGAVISEDARGRVVINAARFGRLEIIQALLANGAIPADDRGQAFIIAARRGHTACITALLANGAVISAADRVMALGAAFLGGHLGIFEALLARSIQDKTLLLAPVPEAINAEILALGSAAPTGDYNHLVDVDLPAFINTLTPAELSCSQAELVARRAALTVDLTNLRSRLAADTPYLGTPPAGTPALAEFYRSVKYYLSNLDGHLSLNKDERAERLQILRGASVCGGGLLADLQQLHSLKCEAEGALSCQASIARWLGGDIKRFIESINPIRDVHTSNILQWQLRRFIAGRAIVQDTLAHPQDEFVLLQSLYERLNPLHIAQSLAHDLKDNSVMNEKLLAYIDEELFDTVAPDAEIRARLGEQDAELARQLDALPGLKAGLEGIDYNTFNTVCNMPTAGALRICLGKPPEALAECEALMAKKPQALELRDCLLAIRALTQMPGQAILGSSPEAIRTKADEACAQRARDLEAERFTTAYRNEDGSFKPEGLALILLKMGLLKAI